MLSVVSAPRQVAHEPVDGSFHPERPDRLRAVLEAVAQVEHLALPEPGPASDDDLRLIHGQAHLERIADLSVAGGRADADTFVSIGGDDLARRGVACAIAAADAVVNGLSRRAFAVVRPPGHHAEPDRAMGFCLYANAAIAVRHLQRRRGVGRIAIVDFDVHHGNGTQTAFWRDGDVLTVSLHQDPQTLWPGTGFADEVGEGPGEGACLNVPLPPGAGNADLINALREVVRPAIERFRPEILVVCAGFDAHADDPLANLAVTSEGFGEVGRELASLADDLCDGRLVATLEGGYDLAALRESTAAFLKALQQVTPSTAAAWARGRPGC